MAVIYKITNMVNDKYYIGSAQSFEKRKWQHINDMRRGVHKNPRLQAAWNKYGPDAFVFEVIEVVPEDREVFDIENTYLYKCVGQPDCYNINTDARGMRTGIPHSSETKQKLSERVQSALADGRGGRFIPTEETRSKMSASAKGNQNALGHKRTEAEREAIRQRMTGNQNFLGKTHSEETKSKLRRPLFAVKPDGSQRTFVGVAEAGLELGVTYPMLARAAKNKRPIVKGKLAGWLFMYQDDPVALPKIPDEYQHLPRSRSQAKAEGAKQYFTGVPCDRGHIGPRAVKGTCILCRREDEKAARQRVDQQPAS
jgi:group I intron endonuclease